jgi:hypothetical protein
MNTGFWWGDLSVDWRLMNRKEMEWYDLDWIILAQDRDRWCDPMKTIMNFRVL